MSAAAEIRRPVLRYHGGKYLLAPWVISHFPPHRTYVEPFGGAGSVLMQKPRAYAEVYNDLDGQVVNLFRVLRDPQKAEALRARLVLTPFSRQEFKDAYLPPVDDIDGAAKIITRACVGFGSAGTREHSTGFRFNPRERGTHQGMDWVSFPQHIKSFTARLAGVVIQQRDAIALMATIDKPTTLHYVDPPYVQSTRSSRYSGCYRHEMDDAAHRRLADFLRDAAGMVVLSGYRCALYDELYGDWERRDRHTHADGAGKGALARVESVWLNGACARAQQQREMFS